MMDWDDMIKSHCGVEYDKDDNYDTGEYTSMIWSYHNLFNQ